MSSGKHKVVIAGGGTGGHLYPGIAIAEEIKKRLDDVEIVFMGTHKGIEARVLPAEKYYVKLLRTEGFVGVSIYKKIRALYWTIVSFFEAYSFLKKLNPELMIGTGGYASFIPVVAAFFLSIPVVIHEQNSIPGVANRMLSKLAQKICITYESSLSFFPKSKTVLTGNPVREKILKVGKQEGALKFSLKDNMFTVFIFGGSLGARSLNKAAMDALEHLLPYKDRIQFLHQTGDKDYEQVRSVYQNWGMMGTVAPFIYNMPEAYAACDMIVCRAGATTLAEITALGMPAILVPFPYATASHQEVNASRLSVSGAAIMIKDEELNGRVLAEHIKKLYMDENMRNRLKRESMSFGRPEAARKVVCVSLLLIKDKTLLINQEYEARCLTDTE
ncbi:MAG: undecaprenyldiphospho-muramoylpentapeptide beta-N-acetylglucosaminyltransferase [Nitrospirae bacterium]|nr:undecaprenyldiphospho-muramoylpentapeptide beta-N-acetylglucosaminyltransferase [Nitrospirota bacterium]MBF0534219.1 undecaprenyldiphospho-muramoylpentapeptide beta-N-acetylglucosaminyltransferase [Nitrospirota bacterium]MBF0615867.1 undecaprenyldiphospho-muramoylpentapeptide beta-N-acetylglucosaminyltransferase [Nitrospirota bacterium]